MSEGSMRRICQAAYDRTQELKDLRKENAWLREQLLKKIGKAEQLGPWIESGETQPKE